MIEIRASIGEWMHDYATTHYDIEAEISESIIPLIEGCENERDFSSALVDKLFESATPAKRNPSVGGPVPRFSKDTFHHLATVCVEKGDRTTDINRFCHDIESCSIRFEYTFEEGAPNRDIIVSIYERRRS